MLFIGSGGVGLWRGLRAVRCMLCGVCGGHPLGCAVISTVGTLKDEVLQVSSSAGLSYLAIFWAPVSLEEQRQGHALGF